MLGFEGMFITLALLIMGPNYLGSPQQIISDLDTSLNATAPPTNSSKQSLQALLNETLANIAELNKTMESQGIDQGMIITKGFVLDPSDRIVGGIVEKGKPQIINQTGPLIINQSASTYGR